MTARRWFGSLVIIALATQLTVPSNAQDDLVQKIVLEQLTSGDPSFTVGAYSQLGFVKVLRNTINGPQQRILHACVDGDDRACAPNTANELIHGTIVPKINAKREIESVTVQLRSYTLADAQTGSLDVAVTLTNPLALSDPALDSKLDSDLDTAAGTLTVADLAGLTGLPQIQSGTIRLVIAPAVYQQFIQLIPASNDDAPYAGTLIELLSRRHVTAQLSSSFVGVSTAGTASAASFCGQGQRYLVYRISSKTDERRLIGHTRLQMTAAGQFFDCVDPGANPYTVGAVDVLSLPTTGSALPKMFNLLSILFISKSNSWTNVGNAGSALSTLVDVSPTSSPVLANATEQILQQLVDNLCTAFKGKTNQQQPAARGRAGNIAVDLTKGKAQARGLETQGSPNSGGAPGAAPPAAGTPVSPQLPPIDFGNFTGPVPYPLHCTDAHLRVPPAGETDDVPVFERNKVRPTPIPTNTIEP
ncbi:MAG: hypothetical protein JO036_12200 [Candidatus Eremiobacteraeota bacterium]|nr:hypothetical protein [Candidatus Eremiobacteraeota bacterium]